MARYTIDPEASQVWIEGSSSVHPIHATATGLEGWVEVAEHSLDGEVQIEVDRLRSGNGLVDRETRRRIDARRFPYIVGRADAAESTGDGRFAVTGTVVFRGEDQQVNGELRVALDEGELVIEGSQTFDVREWGLEPPRLGLLKVHPEIDVRVRLCARVADGP
jgi:polyisoprenoid-binding protein YceI